MLDQPITSKMLAEKDGAIGRIIFNNPARHNAVSLDMWQAVSQIMDDFNADDRVRVIVLTGAGGKAFVSGAGISEFKEKRASAEEALAMGLINRLVPDGELETYVQNYCDTIAANAPLTIRSAKVSVREALKPESQRDLELCKRLVAECFASEGYTEGRTAFMEKRRPVFKGR